MIHTPCVTSPLFIRDRATQTVQSLLHSNFGAARCSRRPIEREENKSGKIFSTSKEKALGNFIQTDGRVAGGKIVWQKVKSSWFRGSGYFSVERGKSESLTRAPFIFRRRDPPRGKDGRKGHRPGDNASKSSLHSGSRLSFIVCYLRIFGDSFLSTYMSGIERHAIGFRCEREFYRFGDRMKERREKTR